MGDRSDQQTRVKLRMSAGPPLVGVLVPALSLGVGGVISGRYAFVIFIAMSLIGLLSVSFRDIYGGSAEFRRLFWIILISGVLVTVVGFMWSPVFFFVLFGLTIFWAFRVNYFLLKMYQEEVSDHKGL